MVPLILGNPPSITEPNLVGNLPSGARSHATTIRSGVILANSFFRVPSCPLNSKG